MFLYALPLPLDQVLVGEDFRAGVLERYRLQHLDWRTARDVSYNEAHVPGLGKCTILAKRGTDVTVTPAHHWHTIPLGNDHHIALGWTAVPGPDDLARKELIPGYLITDDAGREWRIPIARSTQGRTTLPTAMTFDLATGDMVRQRKQSAQWLWDLSGEIYDRWHGEDESPIPDQWFAEMALRVLTANYRISMLEVNALAAADCPLLDDIRAAQICLGCIDFEVVREHESVGKKNTTAAPATSNS